MARNRSVIKTFCLNSGIIKMALNLPMVSPFGSDGTRVCTPPEGPRRPARRPVVGARWKRFPTLQTEGPGFLAPALRYLVLGFILLRTGFFGPGMTSVVPPLASIFSLADLEK